MNIHLIKPHLLVVGGTGFIGYHLVKAAKKKGWKVTSISAHKLKKHRHVSGVKYLFVDIGNFEKLKKKIKYSFTYVVNLSGYVDHASFFDDKSERIIKAHFFGTINLTKAINKKKIKKFIKIRSSDIFVKTYSNNLKAFFFSHPTARGRRYLATPNAWCCAHPEWASSDQ